MRSAFIGFMMLGVGFAPVAPTMAAPSSDRDAYAATNQQAARARAQADCRRQADAMKFGIHFIQRRNFIRKCMTEHGFPRP
jgi:hypothetical protein